MGERWRKKVGSKILTKVREVKSQASKRRRPAHRLEGGDIFWTRTESGLESDHVVEQRANIKKVSRLRPPISRVNTSKVRELDLARKAYSYQTWEKGKPGRERPSEKGEP